jgi:DNA-binding response OmpR family regulator
MPHALLIEDDPDTAELTTELLAGQGFDVLAVSTAADARGVAQRRRFDLVLLDLVLPDGDGMTLLLELRRATAAPIVVCSATNRHRDSVLALRLGADDFVAKPFDILEFEERVRAAVRRAAPAPHAARTA